MDAVASDGEEYFEPESEPDTEARLRAASRWAWLAAGAVRLQRLRSYWGALGQWLQCIRARGRAAA